MTANHDVFKHCHLLRKPDILKRAGHAKIAYFGGAKPLNALAAKNNVAFLRGVKTAQHVECCGFTRAVGADNSRNGTLGQGYGKIAHGSNAAKTHGHVLGKQQRTLVIGSLGQNKLAHALLLLKNAPIVFQVISLVPMMPSRR